MTENKQAANLRTALADLRSGRGDPLALIEQVADVLDGSAEPTQEPVNYALRRNDGMMLWESTFPEFRGLNPGEARARAESAAKYFNNLGTKYTATVVALYAAPVPAAEPTLTFSELSRASQSRAKRWHGGAPAWSLGDWMLALAGELGEACNIVKKLNRSRDGVVGNDIADDELRGKLRRELGDVMVYLDLAAQCAGVDLAGAVVEVFNAKSEKLGFPERLALPAAERVSDDTARLNFLISQAHVYGNLNAMKNTADGDVIWSSGRGANRFGIDDWFKTDRDAIDAARSALPDAPGETHA